MAKGTIASLLIALGIDVRGVKTGTSTAQGIIEKFAGQSEGHLAKFDKGWGKVAGGGIALGGALTAAGAGMVAISEPLERAQVMLEQTIANTGKSYDDLKPQIASAVATQEKFGHSQADTEEALTKMTAAFQDPAKALKEMGTVQELAAFRHISLADAAQLDIKMHAGAGRTFKEFGINVTDSTKLLKAAATAQAADRNAGESLQKAKQHLADTEAELAGKSKLSVAEQIRLRDAHQAVTTAAQKATDAHTASVAAVNAAKGATANYDDVIHNQLLPRIHGLAEAQSDTFGGKIDAYKTHIGDMAAQLGKNLGPALVTAGPAIAGLGSAMEMAAPVAKGVANVAKWVGSLAAGAAQGIASAAAYTARFVAYEGVRFGLWVGDMAKMAAGAVATAARASAAWLAHTAVFLAQGAVRLGAWAVEMAKTVAGLVATGAVAVATWVANTAVFLTQQAIRLASWLATNAIFVATAIATGVAAAAAFLLPLLPFILIGLAVALLVVLVVTHFTQIKAFITRVVDAIRTFFEGAWQRITAAIGAVIDWVKANWPLLLAIILGPIALAVVLVITHFAQIKDALGRVFGWFAELPGKIMGALGNLGNLLKDAGAHIIEGLLKGITDKFKDVQNFVGGIGDWIGKHKGPLDYDAQLLHPHGLAIMGGLHEGLSRGFGPVKSLVAGAGAQIASGFGLGAGPSVAVGGAAGAVGPLPASGAGGAVGGSGGRTAPLVGQLIVNNPKPEPVGTSVERELRKLQVFGAS